jgi:hypothetical protein
MIGHLGKVLIAYLLVLLGVGFFLCDQNYVTAAAGESALANRPELGLRRNCNARFLSTVIAASSRPRRYRYVATLTDPLKRMVLRESVDVFGTSWLRATLFYPDHTLELKQTGETVFARRPGGRWHRESPGGGAKIEVPNMRRVLKVLKAPAFRSGIGGRRRCEVAGLAGVRAVSLLTKGAIGRVHISIDFNSHGTPISLSIAGLQIGRTHGFSEHIVYG